MLSGVVFLEALPQGIRILGQGPSFIGSCKLRGYQRMGFLDPGMRIKRLMRDNYSLTL